MRKPSAAAVLAVLLVLSWVAFLASGLNAQPAAKPANQKWEYKTGRFNDVEKNELGEAGWELQTSVSPGTGVIQHTFKRAK